MSNRLKMPFIAMLTFVKRMLIFATVVLFIWIFLGRPNSVNEFIFLQRMSFLDKTVGSPMDLSAMMDGNWELVCDAHGYGGDFYLKKYRRTYPSVSDMQDGAWGLIFIEKDGSYISAASGCGATGIFLSLPGCIARNEATIYSAAEKYGKCAYFK